MVSQPAGNVHSYLSRIASAQARRAIDDLRAIIFDEIPEAEELIAYGIPTYRLGKKIVSIAAFKHHCSFFPGSVTANFVEDLAGFRCLKGTIQFTPDKPLPEELVRRILRARFR